MGQKGTSISRDFSIDFFKGITIISVIFIHTVWWSFSYYILDIIRGLSLLITIPIVLLCAIIKTLLLRFDSRVILIPN